MAIFRNIKYPKLLSFLLRVRDVYFGIPEEHIIRTFHFIRKTGCNVPPEGIIIDAGAANGEVSQLLSRLFPLNEIWAFEPRKEAFLRASALHTGNKRVHCYQKALSEKSGTEVFHVSENEVSSSFHEIKKEFQDDSNFFEQVRSVKTETIETVSLDECCADHNVLLLKIDTQGHEMNVLRGGINTLKKTAVIVLENSVHSLYENGSLYFETDAFLRQQGFVPADFVIPFRRNGIFTTEFDAIYFNSSLVKLP